MEKSSLIFKTVKVQNTTYEKTELIFQLSTGDQEVSKLSNNIIGQFWHFLIIISWNINSVFYYQVSHITYDILVYIW